MSARGDFASARRELQSVTPVAEPEYREPLHRQAMTLEVLESIDLVRRLLREGDTAGASRASTTILNALNNDEYARLGVAGAALSLLGRATELARRVEGGDRTAGTSEEVSAFVQHMGRELTALERETVHRSLEAVLDPQRTTSGSTLGDLLNRKPWRSGLSRPVEAVPEPGKSGAHVPVMQGPDSPVIGRILIEQEQRERVAAAPQTATQGRAFDPFETVTRAALEYWHVVLAMALLFAAIGYFAMVSAPDRYASTALLQKSPQSNLRAPITNRPQNYVPSLPPKTILQFVRMPTFHERVSKRLETTGWAPGESPAESEFKKYSLSAAVVAGALAVSVEDTGASTFLVSIEATHDNPETAQAIAGAAAEEFRIVHYEYITREAGANLTDYQARLVVINERIEALRKQRLEEFKTDDVLGLGASLEQRINHLLKQITDNRKGLDDARIELKAARQELDAQIAIAERIPEYQQPEADSRIAERMRSLNELESELRELNRKAETYGPEHPARKRIKQLQDDIELLRAEIKALEDEARKPDQQQPMNPHRAEAEDRVNKARYRVTLNEDRVASTEKLLPALESEVAGLRQSYLQSESLRRDETDLLAQKSRNEVVIEEINAVRSSAGRELALVSPATKASKVPKDTLVGIAVGIILGLVVGIGVAVALMRRRQTRRALA